jgi:hypothetical protein
METMNRRQLNGAVIIGKGEATMRISPVTRTMNGIRCKVVAMFSSARGKQSLGRKNLCGLVFAVTEIPVPLIREVAAEILGGKNASTPAGRRSTGRTR